MKTFVRNSLAVLAGLFLGSLVNMALVEVGPKLIPLPAGANVSTMEGLAKSIPLFSPANFLFPFLAHALGTLVAAFVAARFAASQPMKLALAIGVLFLAGGISAVYMLGGPLWFSACDLLFAYIPMSYLGGRLAARPAAGSAGVTPIRTATHIPPQ